MPVKNSDGQLLAVVQVRLFVRRGWSHKIAELSCCSSVLCIYYVCSCPQMPFFLIVFVYFDKFIPAASQSSVFQTCLPGHQQNPRVIFLCGRRHFVCAVTT
jgi:hypothetical protein